MPNGANSDDGVGGQQRVGALTTQRDNDNSHCCRSDNAHGVSFITSHVSPLIGSPDHRVKRRARILSTGLGLSDLHKYIKLSAEPQA